MASHADRYRLVVGLENAVISYVDCYELDRLASRKRHLLGNGRVVTSRSGSVSCTPGSQRHSDVFISLFIKHYLDDNITATFGTVAINTRRNGRHICWIAVITADCRSNCGCRHIRVLAGHVDRYRLVGLENAVIGNRYSDIFYGLASRKRHLLGNSRIVGTWGGTIRPIASSDGDRNVVTLRLIQH